MEFRLQEKIRGKVYLSLHYWDGFYSIAIISKSRTIILESNKGTVWEARDSFENFLREFSMRRRYSDQEIIALLSE